MKENESKKIQQKAFFSFEGSESSRKRELFLFSTAKRFESAFSCLCLRVFVVVLVEVVSFLM